MKTAIFGVLLDVTPAQDTILRRLMRNYGAVRCVSTLTGGACKHRRVGTTFVQRNHAALALCQERGVGGCNCL